MPKAYVTWIEIGYGKFKRLSIRSTIEAATADLNRYHESGRAFKHGWIEVFDFDVDWTPDKKPVSSIIEVYPYMEDDYINSIVRYYNQPGE